MKYFGRRFVQLSRRPIFLEEKFLFDKDSKEHYIKRGDPNKPTYYIIRRNFEGEGLFARYRLIMGHVRYALSKGWIPVVDMQYYPNPYLPPEKLGKENSWEYYFEQPMRVGLEEAYNGENVILGRGNFIEPRPGHAMSLLENKNNSLAEWRNLIKQGYMKIKPARMKEILATREKLFAPNDRVLGVLLRGTDYVTLRLQGHPVQPSVELAISTISKKLKEWNCNKIFLATEDKTIVEKIKAAFGDVCITLDREYVDYEPQPGNRVCVQHLDRENDHFIQGNDYLKQMVLLSMCNSFVGARCSGTSVVAIMGENFEHAYFFNLGRYE